MWIHSETHTWHDRSIQLKALSSGKIDKYEDLTGEKVLLSDQRRVTKQAKFTYSLSGKAFEKQTKTIEKQRRKQV